MFEGRVLVNVNQMEMMMMMSIHHSPPSFPPSLLLSLPLPSSSSSLFFLPFLLSLRLEAQVTWRSVRRRTELMMHSMLPEQQWRRVLYLEEVWHCSGQCHAVI